jgi:hypothetical protein
LPLDPEPGEEGFEPPVLDVFAAFSPSLLDFSSDFAGSVFLSGVFPDLPSLSSGIGPPARKTEYELVLPLEGTYAKHAKKSRGIMLFKR